MINSTHDENIFAHSTSSMSKCAELNLAAICNITGDRKKVFGILVGSALDPL